MLEADMKLDLTLEIAHQVRRFRLALEEMVLAHLVVEIEMGLHPLVVIETVHLRLVGIEMVPHHLDVTETGHRLLVAIETDLRLSVAIEMDLPLTVATEMDLLLTVATETGLPLMVGIEMGLLSIVIVVTGMGLRHSVADEMDLRLAVIVKLRMVESEMVVRLTGVIVTSLEMVKENGKVKKVIEFTREKRKGCRFNCFFLFLNRTNEGTTKIVSETANCPIGRNCSACTSGPTRRY